MKHTLLVFSLTLAAAMVASAQRTPESMLGAALHQEEVQGDLKGAIAAYKNVAAAPGVNPKTAAQALLRMGQAYDKLHDPEAKKVYARVVAEFANQPQVAARARVLLGAQAAVSGAAALPSRILVWDNASGMADVPLFTGVAPDGSFIVTNKGNVNLFRHDFVSGEDRVIAPGGWCPRVSPDGRSVAYWSGRGSAGELRVIGIDGSGMRVLVKSEIRLAPQAWSPDGARLLVFRGNDFLHPNDLALVSVADGSVTVMQSGGKDCGATQNAFSPDGRYIVYHDVDPNDTNTANPRYVIWIMDAAGGGAARLLSDTIANSVQAMWAPDGRSILFTSNRSGSAAIWSVVMADGKAQGSPQRVNQGETSKFLSLTQDGSAFYGTWTNEQDVYVASIDPATLTATSAPQRLNQMYIGGAGGYVWSPDGHSAAYDAKGAILVHSMDTNGEREIKPPGWLHNSKVDGEIEFYSQDGQSLIICKYAIPNTPDGTRYNSPHFIRIDVQSGNETALFDLDAKDWHGFVLSRDVKMVYYSPRITPPVGVDGATAARRIIRRNLQSGEETEVVRVDSKSNLGFLLSPDGRRIAFTYTTADGVPRLMSVSSEDGVVRQLAQTAMGLASWTPDSRHLFIRQTAPEGAAWILYSISADGGEPQPLGVSVSGSWPVAASPQNDHVVFGTSQSRTQVWRYKNLLPPAPAQQ